MRIQTLNLVAGSKACNAKCPYCVSRMTGKSLVKAKESGEINKRNFHKACVLAKQAGTTTVLITGKGEPMLDTPMIANYLRALLPYEFPFIELQTNGLTLATEEGREALKAFYALGLNTIAISVVSHLPQHNQPIYMGRGKEYPNFADTLAAAQGAGLMVRLTLTMIRGAVDTWEKVLREIRYCKATGIEQLALAPVKHPYSSADPAALGWVDANELPASAVEEIKSGLQREGHKLMTLMHGAEVYDVEGVSVCLRDCLTIEPDTTEIRQLIFYPSGRLMYDWQYRGAVLL